MTAPQRMRRYRELVEKATTAVRSSETTGICTSLFLKETPPAELTVVRAPVGNAVGKGIPTVIICFENKVVKINVVKHKLTICPQKMAEDIPDEKSFSRLAQRPICLLRKRYVFR